MNTDIFEHIESLPQDELVKMVGVLIKYHNHDENDVLVLGAVLYRLGEIIPKVEFIDIFGAKFGEEYINSIYENIASNSAAANQVYEVRFHE